QTSPLYKLPAFKVPGRPSLTQLEERHGTRPSVQAVNRGRKMRQIIGSRIQITNNNKQDDSELATARSYSGTTVAHCMPLPLTAEAINTLGIRTSF
ncbi:hypothetical protein J6590_107172, partial [Homalodisca vitripennis]